MMADKGPLFEEIFGEDWASMPAVFHNHYANRTHKEDVVRVAGAMNVRQSWLIRLAAPFFLATKTLIPIDRDGIETEVIFRTQSDSDCF